MRFLVLSLGVLAILVPNGMAAPPTHPVTIAMEAFANAVEGGQGPRCDVSAEVGTGRNAEWWITMGEARPDPRGGWEGVDKAIRCGRSPEETRVGPGSSPRTPYLTATVSTAAWLLPKPASPNRVLHVEISLSLRKLSGFGATGVPSYERSTEKRTFLFVDFPGTALLPLIVANGREKEAFGVHEALIRIRATPAGIAGPAGYGALSVSSDLDGAELLLDGGVVGRMSAGKEAVVTNVRVGEREVSVRDSSGREVHRVVRVEANRSAMVSLKLPDPACSAAAAPIVLLGNNAQGYEEYGRERDGAHMVRIPAGEFLMGNRDSERNPFEHQVHVSEFLMDQTPVTWGQFKRFAGATGASLPPNPPYWGIHDDHPAVFVTWEEAKAYCEWVGGWLPTEAEREKAARGTDGRKYPWGNEEPDPQRAVYRRTWGMLATDPVGAHPSGASPYGLLDMGGTVWEWVADWYDDKYYEVSPRRDPKGPRTGQDHVVRGGSWDSRPSVLSASVRNWGYRGYREGDFGFRCARDPVE